MIVASEFIATAIVLTVNFANVDPAAIVTVAGTEAAFKLLTSLTTTPPVGAFKLMVTVPAELPAP